MSNPLSDTTKAIALEVYKDAAQPAVREIGATLGEVVHVALSPARFVCWSFEAATEFAKHEVEERLRRRRVPPEAVQTPAAEVAGQIVHMLRFPNQDRTIRDMYLNLLATAMDSRANRAHPAFVDVVRQLSPYEARLIPLFAGTDDTLAQFPVLLIKLHSQEMNGGYNELLQDFCLMGTDVGLDEPVPPPTLINLQRLGIIEIDRARKLADMDRYQTLELHPKVRAIVDAHLNAARADDPEAAKWQLEISRYLLATTPFGYAFANACTMNDDTTKDARNPEPRASGIADQSYGP